MPAPPVALCRTPRHPGALDRPRLASVLDLPVPVVAVVAPAGWGKTVLATQLAARASEQTGARTAWARLAAGWDHDEDLVALWAASLGVDPVEGDPVSAVLDLAEVAPTTFVVDDAHLADAESVHRLLAEAAPLLPPGSRFIVAGRTRPAGLLGRLGPSAHPLGPELALTEDEAGALATALGGDADLARARAADVGGWPAVVAASAGPGAVDGDAGAAVLAAASPEGRRVLAALAALPWLDGPLAQQLGLDPSAVEVLARTSGLLTEAAGRWSIDGALADAIVARLAAEEIDELRVGAVDHLAEVDPAAAVEVLLGAGRAPAAADVLADHLSEIGVEHAVAWLYRLPAELRHRFPPVLAAGRATVALDLAEAEAQRRLDEATDDRSRREALLALGSARAGAGRLSAAAESLEAAVRGAEAGPVLALAWPLLARVRAWAGDHVGAAAAADAAGAGDEARLVRVQVALLAQRFDDADRELAAGPLEGADPAEVPPPSGALGTQLLALDAQRSVLLGEVDAARDPAEVAYAAALDAGGEVLATAAVARAWVLVLDGDVDQAVAVADVLERQVGRHDAHARLQGALVRLAVARAGGAGDAERESRRVAVLREAGFAPVEALARRALPVLARTGADDAGSTAPLVVEVLGEGRVLVDGSPLPDGSWRSRKALEVLRVLAQAGDRGLRRDALMEAVWPGREPASARTVLRRALSDVRKVLEPDRPTGEASRFVATSGDRVALRGGTDLDVAVGRAAEDPAAALAVLAGGPAPDLGDAEWAEELRRTIDAARVRAAEAVVASDAAPDVTRRALELLIEAEPWSRDHVDALAALHRAQGDEVAARAVERAWFADDD